MSKIVTISNDVDCHICGFTHKKMVIVGTSGGLIYENYNRYSFVGICVRCKVTVISYHKTIM